MLLLKTKYYFLLLTICCYVIAFSQQEGLSRLRMDTSFHYSGFEMLDSIIPNKRVVFTGEDHTFNVSNNVMKFKLITYLYDHGFRYFVLEFGQGIGYLSNQFVTKNDQEAWRILNAGKPKNEPNYLSEILLPLQKFNEGKALEDQVKIIGADLTRYPIFSLRAMAHIIRESNCEEELQRFYEDLNVVASARPNLDRLGFAGRMDNLEDFDLKEGFKSYRNRLFELSVRNLLEDFYKDTTQFQLSLADNYDDFKLLADELQATLNWYKRENFVIQSHVDRERHLEKRILQIFESDSLAKIGGQFGRCHIRDNGFYQDCYSFDLKSVSHRLGKHEFLKGKILNLPIFYDYYKSEFEVDKIESPYKYKELFEMDAMYIYNTSMNWLIFDENMELPEFILINTFSPYISVDGLESAEELASKKKYRGRMEEDHYRFFTRVQSFNRAVNNDFGVTLFAEQQLFYGFGVNTVSEDGVGFILSGSGLAPVNFRSDSLNLRYTNWNIQMGPGYHWVYTSWFSLYSYFLVETGSAKIREDRGVLASDFTYDFQKNRVNYRNPFFAFHVNSGMQIKMKWFSIFAEGGWGYDITNTRWRNRGILNQSTPTRISGLWLSGGISFYYRGKPYVSNYFL
jgi:hypothetical protein